EIQQDIQNWETGALSPIQKVKLLEERIACIDQRVQDLQEMRQNLVAKISYVQQPDYETCIIPANKTLVSKDLAS
ncbi:MAG: hypothetical protein AAF329_16565, partial [Cyanobacteria bacterium P01_A01_bin.17]